MCCAREPLWHMLSAHKRKLAMICLQSPLSYTQKRNSTVCIDDRTQISLAQSYSAVSQSWSRNSRQISKMMYNRTFPGLFGTSNISVIRHGFRLLHVHSNQRKVACTEYYRPSGRAYSNPRIHFTLGFHDRQIEHVRYDDGEREQVSYPAATPK